MNPALVLLTTPLALGGTPSEDGWGAPLHVARCPYEAPALPAEAETALDATLLVRTSRGSGSAVFISPDGFALTAGHVVGDESTVDVVSHGGATLSARVVRVDEAQDIALLKVDIEDETSCLRPHEGKATLGSDIFILGSPAGEELSFSVSKGIVSGYRSFEDSRFVQLDASVNPGNSGGPAVDAQGTIIGIASWKVSHVSMEGLAFAVPADVALHALWIEFAEYSATDWMDRSGHRAADDEPEDAAAAPAEAFDPPQIRRDRLRTGFITAGSVLLGLGVTTVAVTGGIYYGVERMRPRRWNALRGLNTIGWAASFGGAALLATGLVIPRRVGKHQDVELSLLPGLHHLALRGRF